MRTAIAVAVRARRLGLDYRTAPDGMTVADAARELGVRRWVVDRLAANGTVRTFGQGKARYIRFDDLERLRAMFPPPPARSLTKTQAMRRLGYSETHMTRLLIAGAVRGVKSGERWYVDAEHVEQLERELRRTGATRLDLSGVRALDSERAKCREYCVEIRNKRRALEGITPEAIAAAASLPEDELRRRLMDEQDKAAALRRVLRERSA